MNRFILTDPEKCIRCRTCEVACMMSHQSSATPEAFTSRIRVVKGEPSPRPWAAISVKMRPARMSARRGPFTVLREPGSVEQARCIGRKSCMVACPFGAMQVRVVGDRVQALKCDLCMHREGGPACVEACPTHALRCIEPARLRAERLRNLA
ncbi:4Fe-4S dicluster domain-containing protein [Enterobacter hormaechei]